MYINPNEDDFQTYFFRDFPYADPGSTDLSKVTDQDIINALQDAANNINQGLFTSQALYTTCFLLLAAHNMVMNLRASSQGIAGQYSWLEASKSAGSVAASFSIPQRILDQPEFSYLCKTNYGAKYLMTILPYLSGQVFTVQGMTKP